MSNAPCKNCADRKVGCHGLCSVYNNWALQHKEEAKWEKDSRYIIHKSDFVGTSPKPGKHRKTRGTK
jgi:hypothetical protein